MEKRISIKTIYLLLVISIGLIGLGVGSTYTAFTALTEIDSPIVISSNLTHESEIMETIDINVIAGQKKTVTFNLSNNSTSSLNYAIWYIKDNNLFVGASSGTPTGTIAGGNSITIDIDVLNTGAEELNIVIGIASGIDSVVLGSDMIGVENHTIIVASDLSYDNSNTGVNCSNAQCMIDLISELIG